MMFILDVYGIPGPEFNCLDIPRPGRGTFMLLKRKCNVAQKQRCSEHPSYAEINIIPRYKGSLHHSGQAHISGKHNHRDKIFPATGDEPQVLRQPLFLRKTFISQKKPLFLRKNLYFSEKTFFPGSENVHSEKKPFFLDGKCSFSEKTFISGSRKVRSEKKPFFLGRKCSFSEKTFFPGPESSF